jgi:phosphoenolpyruvate synthase/pyruvate phosphate dikinase
MTHMLTDQVLDVIHATDPALCGGKAVGLGTLMRADVAVPRAIAVTTVFYRRAIAAAGLAPALAEVSRDRLAKTRALVQAARLPAPLIVTLHDRVARLTSASAGARPAAAMARR